ncbi:hypothetical protein CEXT_389291 [Caerostris extrusa]|uniref:Uncharacterized protein n=1 Tax=Caerostris extrusa TaxID=172846 RepID=A0AAV4PLQ8_CAEEX|nr:hypothetical protein CEXT_389291 [Caerostris extrusa]
MRYYYKKPGSAASLWKTSCVQVWSKRYRVETSHSSSSLDVSSLSLTTTLLEPVGEGKQMNNKEQMKNILISTDFKAFVSFFFCISFLFVFQSTSNLQQISIKKSQKKINTESELAW